MKLSFIVPATDKKKVKTLEASLNQLGIEFELIPIYKATSMFDAWGKGLKLAKHDTLVLTHQDTQYLEIPPLNLSQYDMLGVAGTTVLHPDQPWWFSPERAQGGILAGQIYHKTPDGNKLSVFGENQEVVVLDGVCLITKKETLEDVGIPNIDWAKWDFYDHVISLEYKKKGLRLATIPLIMVHDSVGGGQDRFDKDRERFREEYLDKIWRVERG